MLFSLAILLLATPDVSPAAAAAPRADGPRVLTWEAGAVTQAWPSEPVPSVVRPHSLRPTARPFGLHPGELSRPNFSYAGAKSTSAPRVSDRRNVDGEQFPRGGWRRLGLSATHLR